MIGVIMSQYENKERWDLGEDGRWAVLVVLNLLALVGWIFFVLDKVN